VLRHRHTDQGQVESSAADTPGSQTPPLPGARAPQPQTTPGTEALPVILVAASRTVSDLLANELRQGGLNVSVTVAANRAELRAALARGEAQIVVTDYGSQDFPATEALAEMRPSGSPLPLLVAAVSEEVDPMAARWLLNAGATDVIRRAHLDRLPLAVVAALRRPAQPTRPDAQAAALAAFAAALRSTTSREAMLPVIIQQVQSLLGVTGAAVLRHEAGSEVVSVEVADGWLDLAGAKWPAGTGRLGEALMSGRPVLAALTAGQPERTALAEMLGLTAAAYAPLIAQGITIGALAIATNITIEPAQFDLLDAIADMVASALHRAALHEQTELRLRRLAALHAVDIAITTSFDLRVTLGIALDHLVGQTQVDAASVLLLNNAAQTLEYAAVRGFHTGVLRQPPVRIHHTLAGQVIAQRQPVHLGSLAAESTSLPPILHGYTSYYGVPLMAKGRMHGVLELLSRGPLRLNLDWVEFVASMATQAAIAIDNATLFSDLQRTNAELNLAYDATIEGWPRVLEARGIESEGHARRVAELATRTGRAAGLSDQELSHLRRGALLHDIGMLVVPESIVFKPGPLSAEDRARLQQHPERGFDILAPIHHLRPALDIPYSHHERWDGTGYPRGLKGEQIPVAARLFAVADVWDALSTDRPFRRAWPEARARDYLREHAGSHFDPQAVNLFLQALNGSQGSW
jgi:HD-GYP domain-containing protein (c-di-GMP phosphodiesterase class II)/DNA-binding response OmpR family regulator